VIVDDISFYSESWFQRSTLSSRIDELVAGGITYLSAAGNQTVFPTDASSGQTDQPVNGWRTSAYRPTTCDPAVVTAMTANYPTDTYDCLDFNPGGTPDSVSTYTIDVTALNPIAPGSPYNSLAVFLQWGEPFGAAQGQFLLAPVADSDAFLIEPQGFPTATTPFLDYEFALNPTLLGDTLELGFAIVRITTPGVPAVTTPAIGMQFAEDGPQFIESVEYPNSTATDTVGRTIVGHNGAPSVLTISATDATDVDASDRIDFYSSLGPVTYYLSPQTADGSGTTVLAEPETHQKPSLMSVDGIYNTVLGQPSGTPGVLVFRGTSAATPNAGAVVALGLQLYPALDPATISRYLAETTTRLPSPYPTVPESDSIGAGLVNAEAFLQRIAADFPPNPAPRPMLAQSGAADATGLLVGGGMLVLAGAVLALARRRTAR
jgi:hypothetical protein